MTGSRKYSVSMGSEYALAPADIELGIPEEIDFQDDEIPEEIYEEGDSKDNVSLLKSFPKEIEDNDVYAAQTPLQQAIPDSRFRQTLSAADRATPVLINRTMFFKSIPAEPIEEELELNKLEQEAEYERLSDLCLSPKAVVVPSTPYLGSRRLTVFSILNEYKLSAVSTSSVVEQKEVGQVEPQNVPSIAPTNTWGGCSE